MSYDVKRAQLKRAGVDFAENHRRGLQIQKVDFSGGEQSKVVLVLAYVYCEKVALG